MAAHARLAVRVGVNLQPGQQLLVNCLVQHAPLARVVAAEGYRAGASYVDVYCGDQHLRRAQAEGAPADSLDSSPPWLVQRLNDLGDSGGALLAILGNPDPGLFEEVDGSRLGRTRMRSVAEAALMLTSGRCNRSAIAYPTTGWATSVFGDPDVDRLWEAVATAVRLDEPGAVPSAQTMSPEDRQAAGINHSSVHTDFMIGSNEVAVSGVTATGDEIPILRDGDWVSDRRGDSNCRPSRPKRDALPG